MEMTPLDAERTAALWLLTDGKAGGHSSPLHIWDGTAVSTIWRHVQDRLEYMLTEDYQNVHECLKGWDGGVR